METVEPLWDYEQFVAKAVGTTIENLYSKERYAVMVGEILTFREQGDTYQEAYNRYRKFIAENTVSAESAETNKVTVHDVKQGCCGGGRIR
jgi:hypothetical protein